MANGLEIAQTRIGKGPLTIDDVTTNAVILLRNHENREIGVMNFDIMDAPKAYLLIPEFVDKYTLHLGYDIGTTKNIEALIVGGNFREHSSVEENILIFYDYTIAANSAKEHLRIKGINATYIDTDIRATKTIRISKEGRLTVSEKRVGLNREEATMSKLTYDMTVGKHDY